MNRSHSMTDRQRALARCDASESPPRHVLYGQCVACGAIVCDWRRLIGVGARLAVSAVDPATARLTHPAACGACGGPELAVCALGAGATETSSSTLMAMLGRFVVERGDGERGLVSAARGLAGACAANAP
jgi:hypothetical protein